MYCHLCGATVSEGAETCPECGVDLDAEIGGEDPQPGSHEDESTSTDTGRSATGQTGSETDQHRTADRTSQRDGQRTGTSASEAGGQQADVGGADTGTERSGQSNAGGQQRGSDGAGQSDPPTGTADPTRGTEGADEPAPPSGGQPGDSEPHREDPDRAGGGVTPRGGQQGAQPGHGDPVESAGSGSPPPSGAGGGQQPRGGGDPDDGFDGGSLLDRVPIVPGALVGGVTAIAVFLLGWLVAVAFPAVGDTSTLGLGALVTMDLHFAAPGHAAKFLFSDLQTADPPEATLGILYVLVPYLLYQVSKLVVDFGIEGRDISLPEGALSGMTIVLGYLPVMFVVALMVPSESGLAPVWRAIDVFEGFSLATGIALAGLVYPLLFGAIGGVSGAYFSPGQRRVGLLYGIATFFTGLLATLLSSYLFIDTSEIELGIVDRLLASIGAFVQIHTLSFINFGPYINIFVPLILVLVMIGAMGFLRVWRSEDIASPVDAFTRAMTPTITYAVLLGLLGSLSMLVADPWMQEELGLGAGSSVGFGFVYSSVATMFPELLSTGPFMTISTYVSVVGQTFLLLPILLGGTCGILAWAAENYTLDSR